MEGGSLLQHMVLKQLHILRQKEEEEEEPRPKPHTAYKNEPKVDPRVKCKT